MIVARYNEIIGVAPNRIFFNIRVPFIWFIMTGVQREMRRNRDDVTHRSATQVPWPFYRL